jgi:hypothetical protein
VLDGIFTERELMKLTKAAFFPKVPYEGLVLESSGNFADFISFVSSRKTRYGPV